MGPKRKNGGGRVCALNKRKRKTGGTPQGDDNSVVDVDANTTRAESLRNSDIMDEPEVDRIVKVELGYVFREPSVDVDEAEITGRDTKPLDAISSSSKSSKRNQTTSTECRNFNVEGEGNSDKSSHSCYWKLKSEELAKQKFELEKKTWELEADLAYWKGKAKELERNILEAEPAELVELPCPQSTVSRCLATTELSTSSCGTSGKSEFFPTCPTPSMDKSSNKTGSKNANNRFRISKADKQMKANEVSSECVCLVDLTEDGSAELNPSQMIGPDEKCPSRESSSLCSASSPEYEMTSRYPKRRVLRATAAGSKSYKLQVANRKKLAPKRRLVAIHQSSTLVTGFQRTGKRRVGRPKSNVSRICPECGLSFSHKHNFQNHVRRHSEVKDVPCDFPECTKKFKTHGDMRYHYVVHKKKADRAKYYCQDCGAEYLRGADVRRHMKESKTCRIRRWKKVDSITKQVTYGGKAANSKLLSSKDEFPNAT